MTTMPGPCSEKSASLQEGGGGTAAGVPPWGTHGPGVRDGQTSPLRPRLVVSRSTCPPLSPSPHANSFVIGAAVINTRFDPRPFFPSMAGHSCLTLRATFLFPPRRPGEYWKGMIPARALYQGVRGSVWDPEPLRERVSDWGGPDTVCALLCVAARRATRPNGEWGYSTGTDCCPTLLDHFQQFCRLDLVPGRRHHGMRLWRREPKPEFPGAKAQRSCAFAPGNPA
jgi:hypothetical protein